MIFTRAERVGGLLQKALAEILTKNIKDPRLASTTVTGVKMSRDLRLAKVYFSTYEGKRHAKAAEEGFMSARGFLKRMLAQELGLRYMPDLRFYYDETFDYGSKIDKVLASVIKDDGSDNRTVE
jgi:ribosome-binding factor A